MKNITLLGQKLYGVTKLLVPGAFIFALFQIPTGSPAIDSNSPLLQSLVNGTFGSSASVTAGEVVSELAPVALTDTFFGSESTLKKTQEVIEKQVGFVSSRKAYAASLAVIQKHENTIKAKAGKYGVPEDVAIGVGLLENGGSETAKSPAGALGVFQLMPYTARSLGLTVNKKVDERRNPELNIDAGMRYLRSNFDRFGDWGLATWAYHAGEGNVSKALKIYAKANHNVNLAGVKDAAQARAYVEKHSITIHKLLSDPTVKQFTKKLNDDSSGYPYKVIATATLFKDASRAEEVVKR